MRIKQIAVKELFGIFDYVIPLNTEERITIIHGLNGFGKTNILRIIDGIFNEKYPKIKHIPFDEFLIEFENNSKLKLIKDEIFFEDYKKSKFKITAITVELIKLNSINSKSSIFEENSDSFLLVIGLDTEKENSNQFNISMLNEKEWINEPTKSIFEFSVKDLIAASIQNQANNALSNTIDKWIDQMLPQHNLSLEEKVEYFTKGIFQEKNWFKDLRKNNSIRLIESQRLINIEDCKPPLMLPTVSTYSDEIAKLMQDKFAEYGKISQSLDRTFPIRAVKQQHSNNLTDEELIEELKKLENTRSRLIDLGLLDRDENPDFDNQPQDIDESTKNILSVYVEDTKSKLSIFDEIANKIELLKNIINRKFAYSYKELNFSKEKGFIFTTCYPNSSKDEIKTLSPQDLSSGEQHELVLLYELLFKVEPNSLVLIDEPELSLHVSWQSQFIEDLKEITKLADLDILMATHSPDIIQEHWDDLTVELKAPGK
ncbi:MAG: AAA family ATPase [Xenococcaceae cyanobacterium MO_188.B19]|nr:AAA family ATPase [Xenococcaceae cyanobacterium MO_188.B19]